MIKIYKLTDPVSNEIRYIGKTEQDLLMRLVGHITEIQRKPKFGLKNDWMLHLLANHQVPIIDLIEEVESEKVKEKEKYWVDFYKLTYPLFNIQYNDHEGLAECISKRKSKIVYEYDLDGSYIMQWGSITSAARFYDIEEGNICYAASGRRKCAGDKMWKYYKVDKVPNYYRSKTTKNVSKYCIDGTYIETFNSAREIVGVPYKLISKCCNGKAKTVYGFRYSFERVEKLKNLKDNDKKQERTSL